MNFKEYEESIKNANEAEARVNGILRGGHIKENYFYYPSGIGVHRVLLSECSEIKEF